MSSSEFSCWGVGAAPLRCCDWKERIFCPRASRVPGVPVGQVNDDHLDRSAPNGFFSFAARA